VLSFTFNSTINELMPYLLGVLGLLMTWELHDLEVRAGRIKALDISNPAAIRTWLRGYARTNLYVHATPNDSDACEACRKADHMSFAPTLVQGDKFAPLASPCVNPAGCRCVLIGLVGGWPAAATFSGRLGRRDDAIDRLTDKEMTELIKTGLAAGSGSDRLGIYLLEALRAEGPTPQFAISRYRRLILSAKEDGDHPFVVPAYLRLSDLLERTGRSTEALDVLDDFYTTFGAKKGPHSPTTAQSILTLSARRARLLRKLRETYRLGHLPAIS
jgi:hypothetical protein